MRETKETKKRKSYRASINGTRNKLTVRGKDPDYVYRFVNDTDDRILELQERGYEIVTHNAEVGDKRVATPKKEGTPNQVSVGGGTKAYLMRIKKEWYEEDAAAKAEEVDKLDEAIRGTKTDYGQIKLEERTNSSK